MVLSKENSELVAEFVGTFLFVLTIPLASASIGDLAPIPIGFMLMAMVFTFGYISGAHFNPAITFATLITRHTSLKKAARYVFAQIMASIAATLYVTAIIGTRFPVPTISNVLDVWQGLLTESVYVFALACVVLHVAYSRQRANDFYGFAIGMTVLAAGFSVGGFTGGSFNPAVATGTQLVACIVGSKCGPLIFVWLYWIAPLAGAFLGAFLYNILDTEGLINPKSNGNQKLDEVR